MSDTTVTTEATASAPPPQLPSGQVEVPVNETPVTNEAPLRSEAPAKPEGQTDNKSSNVSRREAIQKAFERSKQSQEEASKSATEKRPQQAKAAEKPEAKAGEKPDQKPAQHRENGRFARDPGKPEQTPPGQVEQTPPGQTQQRFQPLDQNAKFRDAPQRFSEQAKADWAGAPESVRGAVHQMAREFQGAYEKYRGDHEVMQTLRPYHELAQKQGTSIERAFTNYYNMEMKLREDVVGGLDQIVNNLRMKGANGQPITLRDVAYHIMTMSPEQHRLTVQQNQQTAADQRIGQLHQMVGDLTKGLQQMQLQQRYTSHRAEVDAFAEKHPRFDELGKLIKEELDHGYSLEVAYQRAERLAGPPAHAAQTRTQSAQTRRTSISGAPDGNGKNTVSTRPSDGQRSQNGETKHPTRREAIAKAMRRVSNGV